MTSRSRCFFDIQIAGNNVGQIVFELFDDICPHTCENFRCLCTGEKDRVSTLNKNLYYKNCHFHRIVKGVMIQSGDSINGDGTGSESIYGARFNDENFQIKHDQAYLLSMDNKGPNTNGSQFFITTSKASHLDNKHVVFGRVISGQSVVDTIQNVSVDSNNRPLQNIVILRCGQLILGSSEISDRDIMIPTTAVDLDLILKIPVDRFIAQEKLNDDDDDDINKIPDTSANDYLSSKRVDSSGRIIKGRGSVKYTEKSRSRSHTPPHRHSTIKDRSPRHKKRNDLHQTESTSHKYQSRSATTIKHKENVPSNISRKCPSSSSSTAPVPSTKNNPNQEKASQSYRRHSSSSTDDEFEISHSKLSKKEHVAAKGANSLSSSKKKRKYWEKQDESIEQQSSASTTQYSRIDNELLMIKQTSAAQLKSTSDHANFLQQSSRQTTVYKSQSNDEYDVSSKEKAESSSRSYSFTSSSGHHHSHQKKKTKTIQVGQIFKLRKSIERIFECRLKPSSSFSSLTSLLSSSSSSSITTNLRSKVRPCLIWSKKPKIQAFLITRFDGIDINDARFDCGSLPKDYVRKRLVPITPKKGFDGKKPITARTSIKNPSKHIEDSYLLLIPVEVEEKDIERGELLPAFFDENDLLYINGLLLSIVNEENEQQAKAKQEEIKKIRYDYIPNDDDDNDNVISENQSESSSIPIRRSSANSVIDSTEKVQIWMKNYIVHNSFDDDDDEKITLIEGLVDRTEDYSLLLSSRNGLNQQKSIKPVEVLFSVGGWCSGDAMASVEMFDPSSNEWKAVASMAKRRCGVGVGVLKNVLYAIGGHDGVTYLNSVERFDPQTNQWNNEIAPTSSCRASVGVAVLDGCLFVVGGQNGISCLDLVEKYDPSVQQWIRVASMGTKRLGVAVVVFDGYLYAIGGSDGQYPLSTVERYDPKANQWSSVSSMNTQRKHLGCVAYNGYIYVVGGRDDATELSTAERFNPKINQWSPLMAMNSKRTGVGLAVINNHLMAIGGSDGAACLNTVELYDSESNSWRFYSGMNYRRLGSGVGVIKVQQYDFILYKSNSTSNILSTSSDKYEKSSTFSIS